MLQLWAVADSGYGTLLVGGQVADCCSYKGTLLDDAALYSWGRVLSLVRLKEFFVQGMV